MKKTYEPTRSDIETLYSIQSREKEIERIIKEGTQIRIGLVISGIIAFVMVIFYLVDLCLLKKMRLKIP
jgi:hypothetical protein